MSYSIPHGTLNSNGVITVSAYRQSPTTESGIHPIATSPNSSEITSEQSGTYGAVALALINKPGDKQFAEVSVIR
jgi:hypothetical protein